MKEKEKKINTKTKNKKQLHLVLVYPDYLEGDASKRRSGGSYSEGLASISAVIKQGGYKVSLIHINHEFDEKEYKEHLNKYKDADLIGFSTRTTAFDYVKDLLKWTKEERPNLFTFMGGYHPILVPDECIKVDNLDAVCVGEGEYPILELMNRMRDEKEYYDIQSFYFKKA